MHTFSTIDRPHSHVTTPLVSPFSCVLQTAASACHDDFVLAFLSHLANGCIHASLLFHSAPHTIRSRSIAACLRPSDVGIQWFEKGYSCCCCWWTLYILYGHLLSFCYFILVLFVFYRFSISFFFFDLAFLFNLVFSIVFIFIFFIFISHIVEAFKPPVALFLGCGVLVRLTSCYW